MSGIKTPKNTKFERLFLLDGMALAYRAYFSFISHPLINSKGENTSAIFGFVNTLMKILNDEKPDHIAVVFDTKEPTFRHVMYEPYKATRQKMPEDMIPQIEKLKEVVKAFNVPSIEMNGYEADDIMGTLARKAEQQGIETFLVTGDKDFMQLISPLIKMYKPGKRGDDWEIVDERGVKEKFGVTPEHVIDVLGLTGDKSDNVPGIPGIGEKTAIPLVQEYGTIEKIIAQVEKIPQKGIQQKIKEHKAIAMLSKELVTINVNVPIDIDIHHLEAKPYDRTKLIELFSQFEFRSLSKKFSAGVVQSLEETEFDVSKHELINISTDVHSYHLIHTEKELETLVNKLEKTKYFVFDTETTSTDPLRAELVGLSFSIKPREAWYIPISLEQRAKSGELRVERGEQSDLFLSQSAPTSQIPHHVSLPLDFVLSHLEPVFINPEIKKIGQNIKYDILILASHGIQVRGVLFDTMVASYILRPDGKHNLDSLANEHLNYKMISFDELVGTGRERKDIRDIPVEKVAEYSNQDADITLRLFEILKEKLEQQQLLKLCEDVEFPLITVLADMEIMGVKLDTDFLADLSKELERMLDNLTTDIYYFADEKFNINSTQQLGKILFEKLKLPSVRKTKTGFSTDVGVLESLRHQHPIIDCLLEFRQLQKLKSTYVDAMPTLINPRTGKVHTSFNQTITATGRLSSSDPNLQNIPIRTEIGSRMRRAFIPSSPDMLIMSADYSQIELRIMAHISGDEGLTTAFRNGEDIHATTAAKVFGVTLNEVTKEMRRKAKEVNFGIMYGIGPYGLATRLDIPQTEAKEIITKYFERFPKVNQYIFDTIAKAKNDGYVSTLLGRRRYLPDINSRNQNIRSNAERQAINMPIQGTAADMIKIAMIKIYSKISMSRVVDQNPIPLRRDEIRMLLQVHDELVFEIAKSQELRVKSLIVGEMNNALPLSVPIEVEVGVGNNWLEAH
ncbi:MAG: DNA polymerase I [Bacteroidota bacterium]|nr:DNA polymerase I [Bacteroidota bacterium]